MSKKKLLNKSIFFLRAPLVYELYKFHHFITSSKILGMLYCQNKLIFYKLKIINTFRFKGSLMYLIHLHQFFLFMKYCFYEIKIVKQCIDL